MHFDIGAIIKGIIALFNVLPKIFEIFNKGLQTTEMAMEVFHEGEDLLKKIDKPELAAERARAGADLLRSLTPVAFAEYLLRATQLIMLSLIYRWFLIFLERKAKREL